MSARRALVKPCSQPRYGRPIRWTIKARALRRISERAAASRYAVCARAPDLCSPPRAWCPGRYAPSGLKTLEICGGEPPDALRGSSNFREMGGVHTALLGTECDPAGRSGGRTRRSPGPRSKEPSRSPPCPDEFQRVVCPRRSSRRVTTSPGDTKSIHAEHGFAVPRVQTSHVEHGGALRRAAGSQASAVPIWPHTAVARESGKSPPRDRASLAAP